MIKVRSSTNETVGLNKRTTGVCESGFILEVRDDDSLSSMMEKSSNNKSRQSSHHHNHQQQQQHGISIMTNGGGGNREASAPRDSNQNKNSKFIYKGRGMSNGHHSSGKSSNMQQSNEFVMLQRPTILAKPPGTAAVNQENHEEKPSTGINPGIGSPVVGMSRATSMSAEVKPTEVKKSIDSSNTSGPILRPINKANVISAPVLAQPEAKRERESSLVVAAASTTNPTPTMPVVANRNDPVRAYTDSIIARLGTHTNASAMTTSVRLLDENLQWQDGLNDHLLADNNGFLVVGVLGKKGTGKSTLMSLLARANDSNASESVFRVNSDMSRHCTNGVNAYVTCERMILLDVQPLLSASVLDRAINQSLDKKQNVDIKYYENFIELQSLELACFILSVCNVVLVTEDWFCDPNLLRLLQTAEMLLPNMNTVFAQSSSNTASGAPDDLLLQQQQQQHHTYDHHPHLVYVLNKSEYVNRLEMSKMKSIVHTLLQESKLLAYKGSFSSPDAIASCSYNSRVASNSRRRAPPTIDESETVNFVCIPKRETKTTTGDDEFKGMPNTSKCVKSLLKEILAMKRSNCVFINPAGSTSSSASSNRDQIFTEKKWFMFASKVWEAIRKSSLISEYNRLMT